MTTEKNIFDRQDVILGLLKTRCERNIKGLEVADDLKTLLIIKEIFSDNLDNIDNYIGSNDYRESLALMNSLKLGLITKISNI
jgi:hypothetical protein